MDPSDFKIFMNRLTKIISSLQNKMYELYLINSRRVSFVCHLVLHFHGNQVKLSPTYGNTAAGFSYYSRDRAVHNIFWRPLNSGLLRSIVDHTRHLIAAQKASLK
jgi:hypothetical protein